MRPRSPALLAVTTVVALALFSRSAAAHMPDLSKTGVWTWFEDDANWPMTCLDGSNTGYGYYVPARWNGNILFAFDGGGLCYDARTCATVPANDPALSPVALLADESAGAKPPASSVPFAMSKHYSGVPDLQNDPNFVADTTELTADSNGVVWNRPRLNRGILDPSANNPFADYLKVFVPYCTGDLHIGYKQDTGPAPGVGGRQPSNIYFDGIIKSYYTFYSLLFQALNAKGIPRKILLTGGSAGGFGVDMLAPLLRYILGPAIGHQTQVVTVSDGGLPLYEGHSSNGTTWDPGQQGYMQRPGVPLSSVSSMGEWLYDAWGGAAWSQFFHDPSLLKAPLGDGYAYVSMHDAEQSQVRSSTEPSSVNYGDEFAVVDSTNDWLYPIFFGVYMNSSTFTPHTCDAENEIVRDFASGLFFPIDNPGVPSESAVVSANTLFSMAIPWNEHHTFILDDVSGWGASGSNLNRVWSSLGLP